MNAQLPIVQGQSLTVSQDTAALVRELALDHLRLRLRPLNRALRELAQARADRTGLLHQPAEDRPSITNQHMLQLFEEIEAVTDGHPPSTTSLAPNSSERAQEAELRRAADELGTILPIVAMRRALGLSEFEVGAVVTCAAPQLRLSYHRIFAFVHDDLNRLAPSTELLLMLEGRELARQLRQRAALAPHGKLLRLGLLHSHGEPANELQREFALAQAKLPSHVLDELVDTDRDEVAIGTMHLAKGLEFRAVVVMACDDEVIPLQPRIDDVADEADLKEVYASERHLLYVACTRARDRLFISAVAPVSEFLSDLRPAQGAV